MIRNLNLLASRCSYNWKRYFKISCSILASFFIGCKSTITKRIFGHGWILDEKNVKITSNILDPIEIIENYELIN